MNEKEFIEERRRKIERRLWKEYNPDVAPNMEELTDGVISLLEEAIQFGRTQEKEDILAALPNEENESCDMLEGLGYHSKECWDDCWAVKNRNIKLKEIRTLISTSKGGEDKV